MILCILPLTAELKPYRFRGIGIRTSPRELQKNKVSSLLEFTHLTFHIPTDIAFLEDLFFLEMLATAGEGDGDLDEISFGVDFGRDEGESFFFEFAGEIVDGLASEEEFSIICRIDGFLIAEGGVRGDVEPLDNRTTGGECDVTPLEITLFGSDTLDFCSRELDPRLITLHDFIIEQGFFVSVK